MKRIIVNEKLLEKCNVSLGCLFYNTNVIKNNIELWNYLEKEVIIEIKKKYTILIMFILFKIREVIYGKNKINDNRK